MIGYGLAFVIGYVFALIVVVCRKDEVYPWMWGLFFWGLVFMGLNWIAGLGQG